MKNTYEGFYSISKEPVSYLGTEQMWDGAKSLYEMLEINEVWKPFVTNHKFNLFDYHE